jgi:two-component system nitrogen regulation sensor histidine kinase GlnL
MTNLEGLHTSLLNQLTSEIIVLNTKFNIIWLNDSAKANGWIKVKDEDTPLTNQFSKETNNELIKLLENTIHSEVSKTKRDFKLFKPNEKIIMLDLTVIWSQSDNFLIIELLCTDNLNKIIDSSKTFSTQKIAANLARTLAHEVKNPLSGIKGSAQILSSKLKDDFSNKFLKIITDETERLNQIVTKILTPPTKTSLELFNIHSALEKVFALTEADENNSLSIYRDYDPSIPELNGDENLFIQAVLNIVKNAQQALAETQDAKIVIKSRIGYGQPINGVVHSTLCIIDIIDNGPGIAEDIHDQVFFPMVSSKEEGSGLGLSISQDIIRVHGGSIDFTSDHTGTVFSILMPLKLEDIQAQSA